MTMSTKYFSVILFFVYFLAVARADFLTPHLGDFVELHTALRYCKTPARKEVGDFSRCTDAVVNANTMKSVSDLWTRICSNSEAYLDCWKPIIEKSKTCNAGSPNGPPSVYKGSLAAICGNDKGVKNSAALEEAMNEISTDECSASGAHWMDACKSFESDMSSSNVCTRHRGLSNCMGTIICKEMAAGKFFLDIYKEAGTKLGC